MSYNWSPVIYLQHWEGLPPLLGFDDSALALQSWMFGSGFDDGLGSFSFADDSNAGELFVEDYADIFADEGVIAANQGLGFVLATITFTALEAGTQTLSLLAGAEFVSFDNQFLETLGALEVSFNVTAVPEPAVLLLMLAGLAAMGRRKPQ